MFMLHIKKYVFKDILYYILIYLKYIIYIFLLFFVFPIFRSSNFSCLYLIHCLFTHLLFLLKISLYSSKILIFI